jgi:hypothetical protein
MLRLTYTRCKSFSGKPTERKPMLLVLTAVFAVKFTVTG